MPPEAAELMEKIDSSLARIDALLRDADETLQRDESAATDRELEASDAEADEAISTLRRAGLIPA